jgi:hypothetical protein
VRDTTITGKDGGERAGGHDGDTSTTETAATSAATPAMGVHGYDLGP